MNCTRCGDPIEVGATVYRVACGKIGSVPHYHFHESHETACYCAPCNWRITKLLGEYDIAKRRM